MNARFLLSAVLVLLLTGLAVPVVQAQNYSRIEETRSNVAYFYHARPGEPTIQVAIWGTVPRPGIYEVREDTDLDKLLTMAGGIPLQARTEGQEVDITVRLFRQQTGERSLLYEAPMKQLLRETAAYPALQDEDMLVVDTVMQEKFEWRDVLTIVGSVATMALATERIISVLTR